MVTFEKVTQEKYDEFKIFLITNFNLSFQKSQESSIMESFEISLKEGKLLGNYNSDLSLEIIPSHGSIQFAEITQKINEILDKKTKIEFGTQDRDLEAQALMINEYANNSKKFYEHILNCNTCRLKLAEIWKHLYE